MMIRSLLLATAACLMAVPAEAVTFDLSTLNVNAVTGPRPPHFPVCPCTDATSGTTIFGNSSNGQVNGWTEGTGGLAATLYFMGNGRGNNSGKIYVPTGGPSFPIPTGQSLGSNNTQFTGDFAQGNGFPLYFWFGAPGSTSSVPATGVPVFMNSFYIAGASGITVNGYSDLGTTLIDSMFIPSSSGVEQITLDWAGIEQLSFTGGSGFYVNDIEVNDPVSTTPLPAALPLFATGLGLMGLLGRRRRRRGAAVAT